MYRIFLMAVVFLFAISGCADDHLQYLLADGVRDATDGYAVTGSFSSDMIPVEGEGTRLMSYNGKRALRVYGNECMAYSFGAASSINIDLKIKPRYVKVVWRKEWNNDPLCPFFCRNRS